MNIRGFNELLMGWLWAWVNKRRFNVDKYKIW